MQMQQPPAAKDRAVAGIADHRSLIDDKHGAGALILSQAECVNAIALLAIDAAVDGVGRVPRIVAEDVRGATRGCHQHRLEPLLVQRLDDGTGERRLARTRITAQDEHRPLGRIQQKMRQRHDNQHLVIVRVIGQAPQHIHRQLLHARVLMVCTASVTVCLQSLIIHHGTKLAKKSVFFAIIRQNVLPLPRI